MYFFVVRVYLKMVFMRTFSLHDRYALRACFLSHENMLTNIYIFPIEECIFGSYVAVSCDVVTFVINYGTERFEVHARYGNGRVSRVYRTVLKYDPRTTLWIADAEFDRLEETYGLIAAQLRTHFRVVHTTWPTDDPHRAIFEQVCSLRTARHLARYRTCLRQESRARRFAETACARRAFRSWVEWYFHPDNAFGYATRLKRKYA